MSSPFSQQPPYQQPGQPAYPQQPYPQQPYPPAPAPSGGSGCGWGALLGCLGAMVVLALLCGGGVWWTTRNFDRVVAMAAREFIVAMVNDSELPAQEKTEVIAQVDRVVNAFKARKISQEELQKIVEELQKSPVFTAIGAWGLDKIYIEPSGLSADEKEQGRRTVERAMRGLFEKKINEVDFQESLPRMEEQAAMNQPPGGPPRIRPPPRNDPISDEEVREMLTDLKKLADDAAIPDEPFQIDVGDEVKKVVDKALEGKNVP